MTKYEEIICEYEQDVDVVEYNFSSDNIKGLYSDGVVAINNKLSTIEKTGIIIEEIGHHFTSYGDIINIHSTSNRKQEFKARMWGYNKLIGLRGLIDAFEHHCQNMYDIADYLNITTDYLKEAIRTYQNKYGNYVELDNYIIQFNYPSIGIIKNI
ncbi:MAG: hypothetical protein UCH84_06090 [Eubacterium sp.]|nr:hypothetical protein [Eubacterium sp.]